MKKETVSYSIDATNKKDNIFYTSVVVLVIYYLAASNGGRGWYWFKEQDKVINESEFYKALHELFPIWLWGFMLLIVAVLYVLGGATFYRIDVSNAPLYLILTAGVIGGTFHFLLVSASVLNAINYVTPWNLAWLTILMYSLSILAGYKIYDRKRNK